MRAPQFARSTFVALASTALLLAAQTVPGHAAQAADPVSIAVAFGQLSVFILDVAAGHDGQARNPAGEQAFQQLFAQQLLLAYPDLDADTQQTLADLPRTRDQLAQGWPQLAGAQRRALAQDWAARVEPMFADMPCDLYIAFERAELVPSGAYEQANTAHLFACWDANPELAPSWARPAGGVASPDPGTSQASNDFVPYDARPDTLPSMLSFMASHHWP